MLGSLFWLFFVSNEMSKLKPDKISLHEDGILTIRSGGKPMMKYLHQFAMDIGAANSFNGD
jgi:hypothetical protein